MEILNSFGTHLHKIGALNQAKAVAFGCLLCSIIAQTQAIAQTLPITDMKVSPSPSPSPSAQAPESSEKPSEGVYEFIAIVNGKPISKSLFELTVQEWIARGQKDTPKLRKDLKEELINRELIAQEVSKQGLDRQINMDDQLQQLKHRLYVQIFTQAHLKEQGFTDESLKQEYQNLKKQGSPNLAVVQYQLKQIKVREKSSALAVIGRLEQGEPFDLVASQLALASGAKPGKNEAVWVNANQLPPALSEGLSQLPIGGINTSPVATEGGWLILKLEDKRNGAASANAADGAKGDNGANGASGSLMSYEEYKNQKVQAVLQQYYNDTLRRLRSGAKINQ
ncbi:peptidylprolyl isomerase [Polynucleobacter sp. Fuers-14]|uniref:peptidylprolyl isomerase n=1 Tax=Polynucleobacter sp. Fuers-14 TaxID=1758364 RepID=UPI001C0B7382|nr:peptidylprolyl isomerase [Polynucleobacter sp. Fuers-14]MBU3641732.1 peptidylprolyl isomerase [Polynucleobacter sp. Fuers-14]